MTCLFHTTGRQEVCANLGPIKTEWQSQEFFWIWWSAPSFLPQVSCRLSTLSVVCCLNQSINQSRTMYQRKVDMDMLNAVKNMLADILSPLSEQIINQSVSQSISQSINQSVNQSISQSVSHSINQSINQSVNQSVSHSINQKSLLIQVYFLQNSNCFRGPILHIESAGPSSGNLTITSEQRKLVWSLGEQLFLEERGTQMILCWKGGEGKVWMA